MLEGPEGLVQLSSSALLFFSHLLEGHRFMSIRGTVLQPVGVWRANLELAASYTHKHRSLVAARRLHGLQYGRKRSLDK